MNWNRSIALAGVFIAFACSAQTPGTRPDARTVIWTPPSIDWPDDLPSATIPKEMIGSLRVSGFPIILEKTALVDARKRLGGTIGSRGDASTAEAWLCLDGADASGRWMLWLSSFEINGPTIGGFQWRSLAANETADPRCRLIGKGDGGIQLPIALQPGMTEAAVRKVLGKPTLIRGRTLLYCHNHQEIIDKQTYDASNNLAVVLRGGVVWAIEAIKSTVN